MYGAYQHITNMDRPEEPTEVVDVVEVSVKINDKFAKQRELLRNGDWDLLVIGD